MKDKNTEEKHLTTIHKSIKQNQKNKYPVIERKGNSTKHETFKTTEKISETKEEKLRIIQKTSEAEQEISNANQKVSISEASQDDLRNPGNNSGRNYGIDALRMLAMFMIVILHVLKQGGVLDGARALSPQYEAAWLLETAAFCAVNCYGIISGYVGVDGKYRFSNIALLWLRVVFYTLGITAIFWIFAPEYVGVKQWRNAMFPVMTEQYWYFTAYFAMFFFMPMLNSALRNLSRETMGQMLIALIIIFSVLPVIFNTDPFIIKAGYSALWLMILYLIGGYIKKYGLFEKCRTTWLVAGYIIMALCSWGCKYIYEYLQVENPQKIGISRGDRMISYISPTMLVAAICLFMIFKRLNVKEFARKIIKKYSPLSFSVYLIHAHPLIWGWILSQLFRDYGQLAWYIEVPAVLGTAAAIYVICIMVDIVRESIFDVFKVRKCLQKLDRSTEKSLDK